MKYFFHLLLILLILSCTGGKQASSRNVAVEKASVQELVSGVEGGGSTYKFQFMLKNVQSNNEPERVIYLGKQSKLFSSENNGEYRATMHLTNNDTNNKYLLKNQATIYFSTGDSILVQKIDILEVQYLP